MRYLLIRYKNIAPEIFQSLGEIFEATLTKNAIAVKYTRKLAIIIKL